MKKLKLTAWAVVETENKRKFPIPALWKNTKQGIPLFPSFIFKTKKDAKNCVKLIKYHHPLIFRENQHKIIKVKIET